MKWVLLVLACVVSVLSTPRVSFSQEVDINGYVLRGGQWWLNGVGHTRTQNYHAGYYSNGCFVNRAYATYSYVPAPYVDPPAKVVVNELLKSYNFDEDLQKTLRARDERAYKLAALRNAGLIGGSYNSGSSSYLSSITTSGSTIYGVPSVNNLVAPYSVPVDVNNQLLAYAQTVSAGQTLQSQALHGVKELAAQTARDQAVLDQQRERFRAAKAILDGPQVQTTNSTTATFSGQSGGQPQQQPLPQPQMPRIDDQQQGASLQALQQYFTTAQCFECHGAQRQEGKLDLRNWTQFDRAKKDSVLDRLELPPEDARFMPRLLNDRSKPGPQATRQERRLLLVN